MAFIRTRIRLTDTLSSPSCIRVHDYIRNRSAGRLKETCDSTRTTIALHALCYATQRGRVYGTSHSERELPTSKYVCLRMLIDVQEYVSLVP